MNLMVWQDPDILWEMNKITQLGHSKILGRGTLTRVSPIDDDHAHSFPISFAQNLEETLFDRITRPNFLKFLAFYKKEEEDALDPKANFEMRGLLQPLWISQAFAALQILCQERSCVGTGILEDFMGMGKVRFSNKQ